MKITRIIGLTVVTIMATTVACQKDFLEVQPAASLSESELASRAGLEGALIGAYSSYSARQDFILMPRTGSGEVCWAATLIREANLATNPR